MAFFPDSKSELSLKEQYEQWKREHPEEAAKEKKPIGDLLNAPVEAPVSAKDPWSPTSFVKPDTQELVGPMAEALDKKADMQMQPTSAPKAEAAPAKAAPDPLAKAAAVSGKGTRANLKVLTKATKTEKKEDLPETVIVDPVAPAAHTADRQKLEQQRDAINDYYQKAQLVMGITELASTVAQMAALWGAANSHAGQAMSERLARTPTYDYQAALGNLIRSKQADMEGLRGQQEGIEKQEASEKATWKDKLDSIDKQRSLAQRKTEMEVDVEQKGLDRAQRDREARMRASGQVEHAPKPPSIKPLEDENARLQRQLDGIQRAVASKDVASLGKSYLSPDEQAAYEGGHGVFSTDRGEMTDLLNKKASEITRAMEANSARMRSLTYGDAASSASAAPSDAPVTVATEAQWRALKPGTKFVDGSGQVKVKE